MYFLLSYTYELTCNTLQDPLLNGSGLKFSSVNDLKRYKKGGLCRTALPPIIGNDRYAPSVMQSFNSSPGYCLIFLFS